LEVEKAEERNVGLFARTKSIVLTISGIQACFPKVTPNCDPEWEKRRRAVNQAADLWNKMEWFGPLWVPREKIQQLLEDTASCSRERALELFDYHTSTIYTIPFQAICIEQMLSKAESLREFRPLAREAYLAFYSGYKASSIAALIPAIEGSLARIGSSRGGGLSLSDKIDQVFDRAIENAASINFERMWVPKEYLTVDYLFGENEHIFVFETFRRWLKRSFFRRTDEYDGATWLNRHLFAHATSSSWQQSANFSRLIVALTTLGVIESWHDESDQIPLLFPEMNEDSNLLWQQALFRVEAQSILKIVEEKRYHDHGRLVPELPTDNGVLLRKVMLAEDCINDLVRPLRDAGWSVEVGEPDDRALYLKVVASAGEEHVTIALLYSCATDNAIYRMLEQTADVILYRGAPYHQDQFAYGIKIHVGPVTGWQPPLSP
jgi:hypothetical protein